MSFLLSRKASSAFLTTITAMLFSAMASLGGGVTRGADLAALVNPFVGTAAGGDIVPGAIAPFGMVELRTRTEIT